MSRETGTKVTFESIAPDDIPLFSICPYPSLKKREGADPTNPAELWKSILNKKRSPTSDWVRQKYEDIMFTPNDIISDVVVEYVENSRPSEKSILDVGMEDPLPSPSGCTN